MKLSHSLRNDARSLYTVQRHGRRRLTANDIAGVADCAAQEQSLSTAVRQNLIEMVQVVVRTLLIFLIFTSLLGRFEIRQTSMEPNFYEGQRVMVSQVGSFWLHQFARSARAANGDQNSVLGLKRGQVVVFFEQPDHQGDALIKRLIALPGDTVEIRDGQVLVNQQPITEPYIESRFTTCSTYCGPQVLGPDEYFFMGDNRTVSRDSRSFGPIPAEHIVGQVVMRFWPLDQFVIYW